MSFAFKMMTHPAVDAADAEAVGAVQHTRSVVAAGHEGLETDRAGHKRITCRRALGGQRRGRAGAPHRWQLDFQHASQSDALPLQLYLWPARPASYPPSRPIALGGSATSRLFQLVAAHSSAPPPPGDPPLHRGGVMAPGGRRKYAASTTTQTVTMEPANRIRNGFTGCSFFFVFAPAASGFGGFQVLPGIRSPASAKLGLPPRHAD